MARVKKVRRTGLRFITIFVLGICCVVLYQRLQLASVNEQKTRIVEDLKSKIEEEKERTKRLEKQKIYSESDTFVAEVARQYLGLVYPDNILLIPEDSN